jgi:hypothetical protein
VGRAERRRTSALVAALFVLLGAAPASAYCRTTTIRDVVGVEGCPLEGLPLYWPEQCVGYRLYQDAAGRIPVEQLAPIVARAFARWTNPAEACLPSLVVVALTPTSQRIGYDADGANSNLVVFRADAWPHDPNELEHSTLTYLVDTGEILDADIEINVVEPLYSPGALDAVDLETVLAHGVGHFLGFSHAEAPSIMEKDFLPGEARSLSTDDVQGMCDVYPEGVGRVTRDREGNEVLIQARTCSLAEPGSLAEPNGACGPLDIAHGCAATRAPKHRSWSLVLVALGALWIVRRARRRA